MASLFIYFYVYLYVCVCYYMPYFNTDIFRFMGRGMSEIMHMQPHPFFIHFIVWFWLRFFLCVFHLKCNFFLVHFRFCCCFFLVKVCGIFINALRFVYCSQAVSQKEGRMDGQIAFYIFYATYIHIEKDFFLHACLLNYY